MFKGESSALKLRANSVEDAREWAEALHTIAARNAVAMSQQGLRVTDGKRETFLQAGEK